MATLSATRTPEGKLIFFYEGKEGIIDLMNFRHLQEYKLPMALKIGQTLKSLNVPKKLVEDTLSRFWEEQNK